MKSLIQFVNNSISEYIKKDPSLEFSVYDPPIRINSIKNRYLNTKFSRIFAILAVEKRAEHRSFFHYKNFKYGYQILEENKINASALSNFTDDLEEYRHFFKATGIPFEADTIEKRKDELFAICFTEDNSTGRFWKEYADESKGICIEFTIETTSDHQLNYEFDLRNIFYDERDHFQFFRDIQNEIRNKFGDFAPPIGASKFSAFYKLKANFDWEKETRLFLNWECYKKSLETEFRCVKFDSKIFLEVPFKNKWFSLNIKSVKAGKNLTPEQLIKLNDLTTRKGIILLSADI